MPCVKIGSRPRTHSQPCRRIERPVEYGPLRTMSRPDVISRETTVSGTNLLPPRAWIDLIGILLLGGLFLSPILASPHFGLFSDYGQVLGWPRRNIHTLHQFLREFPPLADGRWTPMFHILTFGLYTLIGPSAFGFYFVQGLTLEGSLAIVYLLARWLARGSRLAGWASCALILVSAPLAENYFTLDKVEPRVAFFSLLSFGYFCWRVAGARNRASLPFRSKCAIFATHFAIAVFLIFSKETGVFMVGVAFLALIASWLRKDRDSGIVNEAALFVGALALTLALYLWLSNALLPDQARMLREQNGGVGRYLNYGITLGLVMQNLMGYQTWMRDTLVSIAIFAVWTSIGLWRSRQRNWNGRHMMLFLAGSAGCAYFAGMLLWRWTLLYYMLPAVVFLAVAAGAIAFDRRSAGPARYLVPCSILLLLALPITAHGPARWRTAATILAQDRAKDVAVRAMERQIATHSKFAVAMFNVGSEEIGSSLEEYLFLDGYRGKVQVYNLIEGPWVNFADHHRYDGSAAEPPTDDEIDAARALNSPYVTWRYEPKREMHRAWWMQPLAPGDLIVIPVGSAANAQIQARGIAAFSSSLDAIVAARFPGVRMRLVEKAEVPVPLEQDTLGWDLMEVTGIERVGSNLRGLEDLSGRLGSGWSQIDWVGGEKTPPEPFRWGYNGAQIVSTGRKLTLNLEPNGQLGKLPIRIRALDRGGREIALWPLSGRQNVELLAPRGETVTLRVPGDIQTTRDTICFRLFAVE